VNVYVSFVCPNKEIEQKVLFIWLTRANTAINGLTGEWQASTHQLVERLHAEVGDIEGGCHLPYSRCPLVTRSHDRQVQWRSRTLCPKHLNMPDGLLPRHQKQTCCAQPPMPPTVHVTADNTLKVMVGYNDETGGRAVMCPLPPPQLQPQPAPGPSSATAPQWQVSLRQCSG
jgi:hypothetical protein